MRRLPVVDTSALVPVYDLDHPHRAQALEMLEGHDRLVVPTVVLAELTTYIRRKVKDAGGDGNQAARRALAELMASHGVEERPLRDGRPAHRLYAESAALSFADAVVIATAWAYDAGLICFDGAMDKAWRQKRD